MLTNPQFPADLVTFTEEVFNGNLSLLQYNKNKMDFECLSVSEAEAVIGWDFLRH